MPKGARFAIKMGLWPPSSAAPSTTTRRSAATATRAAAPWSMSGTALGVRDQFCLRRRGCWHKHPHCQQQHPHPQHCPGRRQQHRQHRHRWRRGSCRHGQQGAANYLGGTARVSGSELEYNQASGGQGNKAGSHGAVFAGLEQGGGIFTYLGNYNSSGYGPLNASLVTVSGCLIEFNQTREAAAAMPWAAASPTYSPPRPR